MTTPTEYTLTENERRDIRVAVARASGTGAIPVVNPERRILTGARTVVAGYDWAAATWDGTANEVYAAFDARAAALSAAGIYYMQFRIPIGSEVYTPEVEVRVRDVGP